ncbi:hypothetical protein EJ04DRAFT_448401 [Polyplosphaeria fusca]|uniref:Rhodopsin domain-containing protein n=1 Tax=Polyplosphaeria fusca TaxID=682080 RepID=A0A9P4QKA0_9PLEO|nr:hypothetical protein EJ04DRAFT_448401 [Polyplosphaeria fusca]
MLANAPDPNEPQPLANQRATIFGSTISFLIISWVAIGLRLFTRGWVVRNPGWDDFFVTLAGVCNTIATALVLVSVDYGLGQHYLYLPIPTMSKYHLLFYIENAVFVSETAIIKIALLTQYLRIFKAGYMHRLCIAEMIIISLWGCAYAFMAWIPCFPVRAYWNRATMPSATCYGYGFNDFDSFVATFTSHASLNMLFDILVFLTPMVLFRKPGLQKKNLFGLAGIFAFGAIVVMTSIWRLYSIVRNRAATHPYVDFTWWPPISIILCCIEIDLAIICACMPVFWPVIEKTFPHIFITHEVHITEHRRLDDRYELEHTASDASKKSARSGGGNSEVALTRERSAEGGEVWEHYSDRWVREQVDPLGMRGAVETSVDCGVKTQAQAEWRI